jgi:hypothetical protein
MTGDHIIHHLQDIGMIHRPTSGNVVTAFLNERSKASFLFGGVANCLRHEPSPAASLFGDDLVYQFQGFGIDTR